MTKFANLRLVAKGGAEAPYNPSDKDSPSHPDWYESKIARKVRQDFLYCVRWEFNGVTKEILRTFQGGIALDKKADLLIVKSGRLFAINPDGSINHGIMLPDFVEISIEGFPTERFPIDDVLELVERDGRVLVALRFLHDQIERRYYDPGARTWQERDHISRQ